MIDETFSHPYIWQFPENVSHFLFGRIFKSVNFFLDTRYFHLIVTIYFYPPGQWVWSNCNDCTWTEIGWLDPMWMAIWQHGDAIPRCTEGNPLHLRVPRSRWPGNLTTPCSEGVLSEEETRSTIEVHIHGVGVILWETLLILQPPREGCIHQSSHRWRQCSNDLELFETASNVSRNKVNAANHSSSVASFLVWGREGARLPNVPTKKHHVNVTYMRERLRNSIFSGLKIHLHP